MMDLIRYTMVDVGIDSECLANHRVEGNRLPIPLCLKEQEVVSLCSNIRRRDRISPDAQSLWMWISVPAKQAHKYSTQANAWDLDEYLR